MTEHQLPKVVEELVFRVNERCIRARTMAHRSLLRLSDSDFEEATAMVARWRELGEPTGSSSIFADAVDRAKIDRGQR